MAFLPDEEQDELIGRLRLEEAGPRAITDPERLREELARIRERGYAINDEELEEGICAVAVPVVDGLGPPAASLGIATLAFRRSPADLRAFVPILQDAAGEVALQLP